MQIIPEEVDLNFSTTRFRIKSSLAKYYQGNDMSKRFSMNFTVEGKNI